MYLHEFYYRIGFGYSCLCKMTLMINEQGPLFHIDIVSRYLNITSEEKNTAHNTNRFHVNKIIILLNNKLFKTTKRASVEYILYALSRI